MSRLPNCIPVPSWLSSRDRVDLVRQSSVSLAAFFALVALGTTLPEARAQSNPSADQLIEDLRPRTKGLRLPAALPNGSDVSPLPPAPSAGTMPGVQTPAATPETEPESAPAASLNVQFRTNSAELTPAAMRTLDELGRALSSRSLSTYRFRIEGHTDTVGRPEANRSLSERRARAVAEYLAARHGVDRSRLEAVGMGEEGLSVQTADQVPEPRNRRVQVVNIGT